MTDQPIKLLLIEDNPADAKLIEIMLRESSSQRYKLFNYPTFREGMAQLKQSHYDLILLDLSLPDSFGLDTVKNANQLAPEIPIIVLTGRDDEDFALEVVNAGAQDYLVKGQIEGSLFTRAIRYAMKRKELEVTLKHSARMIEESEKRLNAIVTNTISGIVVLNNDKNIIYANPAAEFMLGDLADQIAGSKFQYEFSLESPTEVTNPKSGVIMEIMAVQTDWGGTLACLLALHDITAIKNAEKELKSSNEELRQINRALDNFVYIVSHDLKKPVANLMGLLDLMQKECKKNGTDRAKTLLDKMQMSTVQMRKMIDDLLKTTLKDKTTSTRFEPVALQKMVDDIAGSIENMIQENKVELQTDFSEVPEVFYNWQDLKSIMSNLVTNAIKYHSPQRRPVVHISSHKQGDSVCLKVADNGIGINLAADRPKLFNKYQRLHTHTEGTGLGLWIVKEILDKNGGSIEVESQVDQGTTFKVCL